MDLKEDLTGMVFGRLKVISPVKNVNGRTAWMCECNCGNRKVVMSKCLKNGSTKSCGCLSREIAVKRNAKHGKRHTRIYRIWLMMKNRCNNPKDKYYKCYGGKRITVCDEWSNDFLSFYSWAMSHGYADNLSIDRIDVNGNYEPDNCHWATAREQANNTTRNHYIAYNGKSQSMSMWASEIGIPYSTLRARIRSGWAIENALTEPVRRAK